MNYTESVLDWLKILRNKPYMIISQKTNYGSLQNYIEGYIDGLGLILGKNIRLDITRWYDTQINKVSDCYWASMIPSIYSDKNDQELQDLLITITEDYFRTNPEWYKS